jgi:hypothetical protein
MILVLEDDLGRIEWFRSRFGNEMDWTSDPEKAIEYLQRNSYEKIFLDHDLLPEHYLRDTNCNKTTGLRVAEWIADNPVKGKVFIHSLNWNGVDRMKKVLESATCIPFTELWWALDKL